jgi:RNA polymerase sigma factor (sigma-70 family)
VQYAERWAGTVSDGFEEFYGRRWRDAVRWAAALTGRIDVAEELAQDVFVRMMPHFDQIRHPDSYVYAGISNAARTWHRSEGRRLARERRATPNHGSSDETPEMLGVLQELPIEQRAVVVLRYWLDWDEAAIARLLGCRAATVRTRAMRGLRRLRQALEEETTDGRS